jgi:hypothetical protein
MSVVPVVLNGARHARSGGFIDTAVSLSLESRACAARDGADYSVTFPADHGRVIATDATVERRDAMS